MISDICGKPYCIGTYCSSTSTLQVLPTSTVQQQQQQPPIFNNLHICRCKANDQDDDGGVLGLLHLESCAVPGFMHACGGGAWCGAFAGSGGYVRIDRHLGCYLLASIRTGRYGVRSKWNGSFGEESSKGKGFELQVHAHAHAARCEEAKPSRWFPFFIQSGFL